MESPYASQRVLTPEQLSAIGFVAAEWSNLEFAMMMALGEMLELTPIPAAALGGLFGSVNMTSDALLRIAQQLDKWQGIVKELELICDQINSLAIERNNIVHGVWDAHLYRDTKTGQYFVGPHERASGTGFPKRGRRPLKGFDFTAPEMREVAIASHEATQALLHLAYRKPGSSPDTPTLLQVLERQVRRNGLAPASRHQPSQQ